MAADFRFVVDATQRHAHELAVERAGDGFSQRSLAHSRRPHEAEDGPFELRLQLQDGQIIEDAFLDLLQVVVVGVQDLLGLAQVHLELADLGPGQHHQPVQVGARNMVVGRRG